jgi:hypothetical protein
MLCLAQFTYSVCGDGFEQKSRLERHLATSHPPQAPSAADVEKALSGIQYPRTKQESWCSMLPDREYNSMADVERSIGSII